MSDELTTEQRRKMLDALGKPFPANAVEKRKGAGGRMYDYVAAETVIRRLNSATNGEWSFIVKGHEWRDNVLITWGELTIPGLGTRSGFGVQAVAPNAGEDLIKGSASDCLKKCATQFGVALELYGPDLEAGEIAQAPIRQQQPQQRAPQAAQWPRNAPKQPNPTNAPPPANIDRERANKRLHAVGNKHGINHDGIRALVLAKAMKEGLHISSTNEAPGALLAATADAIEANPQELKAWSDKQVAEQQELMPGPDEVPNPDRWTQ